MSTTVLVPLDGSPLADAAVPRASELARRTCSSLHLVRVHQPIGPIVGPEQALFPSDGTLDAQLEEAERAWLFTRAGEIRTATGVQVTAEFRVGFPVDEISATARGRDVNAIVCTTHGSGGWAPQWLGSVADGLIRQAGCPVLAMSEAAVARPPGVAKMLVLLDGSDVASAILPAARWVSHAFGAQVELLRIVQVPWIGDGPIGIETSDADPFGLDEEARSAKRQLDEVAAGLRGEGFGVGTVVKVSHDPGRAILEHIEQVNPDLVALATHGRGLSRLFVGSVANKVLRAGGRPMLCLRPPRGAQGIPGVLGDRQLSAQPHTMI
jgi:nucleotide-binding universal stress UspA family protein